MKEYKNCPAYLESYLRYMELVEGKAFSTLDGRCKDVRAFLQFLRRRQDTYPTEAERITEDAFVENLSIQTVAAVTERDIEEYLNYLAQSRNVSQHTIYRRKTSSLRSFFHWLLQQQEELGIVMLTNPVPYYDTASFQNTPANPSRALSHAELDRVLSAVSGEAATRDIAMIMVISTTGIAANDLVKVKERDYLGDCLMVAGRKIYLTEATQRAIRRYILEYREPIAEFLMDNTLFVSRSKLKRLSPRGVQKALQKHFDNAGVEGSARDLRYTAVMELLKNARNECERNYLAGYLGYTNPASLNRLPLPKTDEGEPMAELLKGSWLNDLGKRG